MTYFKPLKRTLGLLALLIACLLNLGWLRSVTSCDVGEIVRSQKSAVLVGSTNRGIVWSSMNAEENVKLPDAASFEWKSGPNRAFTTNGMLFGWTLCQIFRDFGYGPDLDEAAKAFERNAIVWHWHRGGFHVAKARANMPTQLVVVTWIVPYWSLVLSFVLLSAWLLFSKPRRA